MKNAVSPLDVAFALLIGSAAIILVTVGENAETLGHLANVYLGWGR